MILIKIEEPAGTTKEFLPRRPLTTLEDIIVFMGKLDQQYANWTIAYRQTSADGANDAAERKLWCRAKLCHSIIKTWNEHRLVFLGNQAFRREDFDLLLRAISALPGPVRIQDNDSNGGHLRLACAA